MAMGCAHARGLEADQRYMVGRLAGRANRAICSLRIFLDKLEGNSDFSEEAQALLGRVEKDMKEALAEFQKWHVKRGLPLGFFQKEAISAVEELALLLGGGLPEDRVPVKQQLYRLELSTAYR